MYSRYEHSFSRTTLADNLITHWNESLHPEAVQMLLYLHLTVVGDAHWKPLQALFLGQF